MSLVLLTMGIAAANFAIGFALAIYLGHGPELHPLRLPKPVRAATAAGSQPAPLESPPPSESQPALP